MSGRFGSPDPKLNTDILVLVYAQSIYENLPIHANGAPTDDVAGLYFEYAPAHVAPFRCFGLSGQHCKVTRYDPSRSLAVAEFGGRAVLFDRRQKAPRSIPGVIK